MTVGHNLEEPESDRRYKNKKIKSRKAARKAERKQAKQQHHRNLIKWKQRDKKERMSVDISMKNAFPSKHTEVSERDDDMIHVVKESKEKTHEDLEIEYLERMLTKNKKSGGKREDLFKTLREEFVNDGFDDEFLDFLSTISQISEGKDHHISQERSQSRKTATSGVTRQEDSVDSLDEDENGRDDNDTDDDDDEDNDEDIKEDSESDDDAKSYNNDIKEDEESEDDENTIYDQCGRRLRHVQKRVTFQLPNESKMKAKIKTRSQHGDPNVLDNSAISHHKKAQIGLINRLSEGNFTVVVKELIAIYNRLLTVKLKSKNAEERYMLVDDFITGLCACVVRLVVSNENIAISLIAIHTALICALCNKVGINIGYVYSYMLLEVLREGIDVLHANEVNEKFHHAKYQVRNCVLSFAVMAYFDMLDMEVIYSCIRKISDGELNDHTSQILLVILRHTGHKMKSLDQASFSNIIDHFNTILEEYKMKHGDISKSRLRFFEQEIQSFKLSKDRNPMETYDFLKTYLMREFKHSGAYGNPRVDIETLSVFTSMFPLSGRSSYSILRNLNADFIIKLKSSKGDDNSTEKLIQKAKAIKLHSNAEKSTFVALAEAISPEHAVERIMDLGFKSHDYPKLIYTVVRMMIAEKMYNEFYLEVTKKLARLPSNTGKKFKRAIVCTMISYLDHINERNTQKGGHLGRFFGNLVVAKVLDFKLVRFLNGDNIETAPAEAFLRELFEYIVTRATPEIEESVISEIMMLQSEEIFSHLNKCWLDYLADHCENKVENNSSRVLLEAFHRIFYTQA